MKLLAQDEAIAIFKLRSHDKKNEEKVNFVSPCAWFWTKIENAEFSRITIELRCEPITTEPNAVLI